MKNKKTMRFLLPVFCAVCAVAAAVLFWQASALNRLETQKQASLDRILTFLQSDKTEKFSNEEAAERFKKQKSSNMSAEYQRAYRNSEGHLVIANPCAAYRAPEGFVCLSYSKAWDEEKLKLLRDELLKNKHGEEINSLSEICVFPADDELYLATHNTDDKKTVFKLNFPAVPKYFEIDFLRQVGVICLYGGDEKTTAESMAKSLSHEYGHHFTFYHMFNGDDLAKSTYAKLRALPKNKAVTLSEPNEEDYLQKHHWYLFEIAADDYVTLMGSPTAKRIYEAKDNRQLLASAAEPDFDDAYQCINASPQENLMIPYATDVKGLAEYFYSFINEKPAAPKLTKQKINITVEKSYSSYNLADGKRTFTYYKVAWDAPYDDPGAVYTLIRFGEYEGEYYNLPVKTVRAGESMTAYVGDVTRTAGNMVYFYSDELTTGTQNFIVSVQLSDGTVYLSDPLEYKFN